MKRLQHLAALIVLPIVLVACKREATTPPEPSAQPPPALAPAPRVATFTATDRVDDADAIRIRCAIDSINTQAAAGATIKVQQGDDVRFVGWVSDAARAVPASFRIVLSGESAYAIEATAGGSRPDVARVLKAPGLARAGFGVVGKLGKVAAGEYAIALTVDGVDGRQVCSTRTRLVVAAAVPE